mmetsp:Transcript_20703/g.60502  ORF Transcript_20703/g.60502 Transcript_20703/m.60502 type:complete len:251 (-) Transcript_20703:203-955(-)
MQSYALPDAANAYSVMGGDCQILNIRLTPGSSVKCEPGVLMHMDPKINPKTSFACSCGRLCGGEDQFQTKFTNDGKEDAIIGLTPNRPAKVVPVDLSNLQGAKGLRCKQGAWMASLGDVKVSYETDFCNCARCCCGGQGPIQQYLTGTGTAFLEGHGTIMMRVLAAGEKIVVDQTSVLAWAENIKFGIRTVGGCCAMCCSGEGFFNATLNGGNHGGIVILESMPFEKYQAAIVPPKPPPAPKPEDQHPTA